MALRAIATDRTGDRETTCLIQDASKYGCRILGPQLNQLPDAISMNLAGIDRPVDGWIVWRFGNTAGVRFSWDSDGARLGIAQLMRSPLASRREREADLRTLTSAIEELDNKADQASRKTLVAAVHLLCNMMRQLSNDNEDERPQFQSSVDEGQCRRREPRSNRV